MCLHCHCVMRKPEIHTGAWIHCLVYCWFSVFVSVSIFASCRTVILLSVLCSLEGLLNVTMLFIWVPESLYRLISKLLWLLQNWWLLPWPVFLKLIFKVRMLSILHWELFSRLNAFRAYYSSFCFKKFCLLQITRNTTPMYRTPEMVDLYSNFPIGEKQDIWVRNVSLAVSQLLMS